MSGRRSKKQRRERTGRRRYWHGGRAGLEVGTILIPRVEAERIGADLTHYDLQQGYGLNVTDPERVYFSSNREFARAFAGRLQARDDATGIVVQHGSLYEVEPIGPVEVDTDFTLGGVSWSAPRARIVAVEETNVQLYPHDISRRLGPYSTWQNGAPVYTPNGDYMPSPEQIAVSGLDTALTLAEDIYPWTPVEFVNATVLGKPSSDRPIPDEHPAILAGALESVYVWRNHRRRAKALIDQGITFTDHRDHIDEINELLPQAGYTVVTPDDERGIVSAIHPEHGLIGAIVFTGANFPGIVTYFVDAIVVKPEWRRHGIGSVLLVTAQQLMPERVSFAAGHCAPSLAPFFAQAGFTVLKPGTSLILPTGDEPGSIALTDDEHTWFYRQGEI